MIHKINFKENTYNTLVSASIGFTSCYLMMKLYLLAKNSNKKDTDFEKTLVLTSAVYNLTRSYFNHFKHFPFKSNRLLNMHLIEVASLTCGIMAYKIFLELKKSEMICNILKYPLIGTSVFIISKPIFR